MEKSDQLGLIKPEKYRSRYDSIGLDINKLHNQTEDEEQDGEHLIIVKEFDKTQLGETALYAAFVQHITGQRVIIRSHRGQLNLDNLPELIIPYMSDSEIAQRFEAIEGADALTEFDQKVVTRTALLIKTHFLRLLSGFGETAPDNLQFDEEL